MINILSIPVSTLTKIQNGMDSEFINKIFADIPQLGKNEEKYCIINNSLTVFNPLGNATLNYFNVFLQMSRYKYNLIQILKQQ